MKCLSDLVTVTSTPKKVSQSDDKEFFIYSVMSIYSSLTVANQFKIMSFKTLCEVEILAFIPCRDKSYIKYSCQNLKSLLKHMIFHVFMLFLACQEEGVERLVYTSSYNVVLSMKPIEMGDESLPYASPDSVNL